VIGAESDRVLRLVDELLTLSRLESGQVPLHREPFELGELLAHVSEVFALRAEEAGVDLGFESLAGVRINGDIDRLEQVFNNLLDNAFRHTPAGGRITVVTRRAGDGWAEVSVRDSGTGIKPEHVPHLFERFYRAPGGAAGRGHGLGLAICREIVRAHEGDIWATSEPGRGTVFTFALPTLTGTAGEDGTPATGSARSRRWRLGGLRSEPR
jgi:two-component system sensor histidine kinase ResE